MCSAVRLNRNRGCDARVAMAISASMKAATRKRCICVERRLAGAVLIAALLAPAIQEHAALAQETCAQIESAAERLACYDRALPPAKPGPGAIEPEPEPQPQPRTRLRQPAPVAEAAPPATGAVQGDEADVRPVVVVGMRKHPGRPASFTTDHGDVWVQIGAESVYLPKVPFDAELRPASMGTFFLRPRDYGWRVHVRRND